MTDQQRKINQLARNIQKDPEDTFSKFALALELLKADEVKKAQMLFEAVIKQDPGYLGVYYHLGKLCQQQGNYTRAKSLFEQGRELAEQKNELRTKSELTEALVQLQFEMEE